MLKTILSFVPMFGATLLAQNRLPESFYIASFENSAWTIVDVQPASSRDSRVRFIRVYPACGTYHVNETDHVFENISVGQLAENSGLCTTEKKVDLLVRSAMKKKAADEIWQDKQGIVAQCGEQLLEYHLPSRASLRFASIEAGSPEIAQLWTLSERIRERYQKETGHDLFVRDANWKETRLRNRPTVEEAAIEIRNGKYDLALPDIPQEWRKDGEPRLSQTMPSPEEAASLEQDLGVVQNIDELELEKTGDVPYPPMARIANIQGDVKVEVSIDPATGAVKSATATSGHPLLRVSATDAIEKWVFSHPYLGHNPVHVTVRFKTRCGVSIETSYSQVSTKKQKKSRSKTPSKK
ncbi:MAG TPA: energy transducer TonB [Candidatus Angelobacter sp.]